MHSELLIIGFFSIIGIAAAFIGGMLYAVKLINNIISREL